MKRHGAIPIERWAEVQRRLDAIERDQHCRMLFAVESRSLAWGFPGPGKWARGHAFRRSTG